jgi:hypothetical protein
MKEAIKFSAIFGLITFAVLHNLALAGDKIPYQNWMVELSGRNNEAYTIADPSTSFGSFCSGEQCLFYLHQGFNCTPGSKYSVLMNSSLVSTALGMECTVIGGNTFQILTPFDAVLNAVQAGDSIGFAVALQSGAFAVTRFSLEGAKPAMNRLLTEVANSKRRDEKSIQKLPIPPAITPKSAPNLIPKSSSKEVSI